MPLDHLWATWRANYVTGITDSRTTPSEAEADGRSLFERILTAPGDDRAKHILWRGAHTFVILNRFPYTVGHLMVLPLRAERDLEGLTPAEHDELWHTVTRSVAALKLALRCEGINVGLNLGAPAGGSQSDHLHVHCVPRWSGDANFISVSAETRVLPLSLDDVWVSLTEAWEAGPA